MKQITQRLAELLSRPLARLQRRFAQARPGSILIMVVALLVLLALMGTAYISSARQERYAAGAGSSQLILHDAVESYARSLIAQVTSMVSKDAGNLFPAPTDGTTATLFLAGRQPTLLPDLATFGPSSQYNYPIPVWPVISRWQNQQFESPLGPTSHVTAAVRYQWGANTYFAPTNIVVHYTSANADTDASDEALEPAPTAASKRRPWWPWLVAGGGVAVGVTLGLVFGLPNNAGVSPDAQTTVRF